MGAFVPVPDPDAVREVIGCYGGQVQVVTYNVPLLSSWIASSRCSFPRTELCTIAFSSKALPYEKYKSAVSGAFSPSCWVLFEGGGVETRLEKHERDLHEFKRSGIVIYSLFIFFQCKGAFGLFN